jgi:tryptophan-rich sensory protein
MNWSAFAVTVGVAVVAATAGNLLIPKSAMAWFRGLRWPRWLVPFQAFIAVGMLYYLLLATVLYRALDRDDTSGVVWAAIVIAANEGWNAVFFGLRSTLGGFVGIVAFAAPLTALLVSVREDRLSALLVAVYLAWVAYDVAWTFTLWRANPR